MKFNMLFLPGRLSDTMITSYHMPDGTYFIHSSTVYGGVCVKGEDEMKCIQTALKKLCEMKQKNKPLS